MLFPQLELINVLISLLSLMCAAILGLYTDKTEYALLLDVLGRIYQENHELTCKPQAQLSTVDRQWERIKGCMKG